MSSTFCSVVARALLATLVATPLALVTGPSSPVLADNGDTIDGRYSSGGVIPARGVIEVDVTGRGGTSTNAEAVMLNLTITETGGAGFATVYPCGTSRPSASTINYGPGATIANSFIATVGSNGRVCIYSHARTHVIADVNGYFPAGSDYRPLAPARLLDTRPNHGTVDGRSAGSGRRAAGTTVELDVTGRGGTAGNAAAVALNLTVTETGGAGFATVYPCGASRPSASTINYGSGTTIANAVIAKVGSGGSICIFTSSSTQLIADVTGDFPAGSDYRALAPARLLDSRPNQTTVDGRSAGIGARQAGTTLELDVSGRGGTANDAAAVSLNLTATQTSGAGFATIYPCGTTRPEASTINFGRGATIANAIVARVGSGGKVCIYTHAATHLIVDVDGYFPSGSDYKPLAPARLLDTRPESPPPPSEEAAARSLLLLNQLRAAHGVGPVTLDAGMSSTALAWSAEMSRSGFRHSSAGYAENIAWHSQSSMSPTDAATTLHNMWVNSSGHFRNMIDPNWTRVGIGMHVDGSGWYGTHMFG